MEMAEEGSVRPQVATLLAQTPFIPMTTSLASYATTAWEVQAKRLRFGMSLLGRRTNVLWVEGLTIQPAYRGRKWLVYLMAWLEREAAAQNHVLMIAYVQNPQLAAWLPQYGYTCYDPTNELNPSFYKV
jgi:hypothetical protein